MKPETIKDRLLISSSRRFALILFIIFTGVISISLIWNVLQDRHSLIESARIQARMAFDKDIVYRRWNASHGGVYIPVTDKTRPNPYLSFVPDRDITTTDGKKLTLMNPAWMTREVYELGGESFKIQSHITSLKPIRPENAADPWETDALKKFEQGKNEISSLVRINDNDYMRLMRPLFTEEECLKCHTKQGYKKGDIRGGISISIAMEPFWAILQSHMINLGLVHILLWLAGVGGLYAGTVWLGRSEKSRIRAIKALSDSENRYRSFFKYDLSGNYISTPEGELIDCNQVFLDIFGFRSLEEAKSTKLDSLYPSKASRDKMIKKVEKEKVIFNYEHKVFRITGEEIIINQNTVGEYDRDNNLVRMHGYIIDITDQKRVEKELKKAANLDKERVKELEESYDILQESQYASLNLMEDLKSEITVRQKAVKELKESQEYTQNLIDSSLDMIIAVDKQRKITEFNQAAESTFGYQKDEVLGRRINILYADEHEGREVHLKTMKNGQLVQEIINKRKNGETFPSLLAASVLHNEKGDIIGVMGVSRDISKQKAAEMAVKESEEKFRTLFEESRDAIYFSTVDGKILDVNKAFLNLFGCTRKELSDLHFQDFYMNPDDRIIFQEKIEKQGYVYDYNMDLKKKNGFVMNCQLTATVRKNPEGKIIGYQGIIRDMTERIRSRKELEDALEKARQAEKVKSLFLANMSHEIRTPLNAILGFSDMIEQSIGNHLGPEEKSFFEAIHRGGDRLMRTIHEILDMSQIEAGIFKAEQKELDLVKLTQDITKDLQNQAKENGLELSYSSDLSKAIVRGDDYCISQALTNIVDNAIKYTNKGRIDVRIIEEDKKIILTVEDTGIGISEEYLEEIFEVFTQESTGYTKKFQGVGLGLALSRHYLELCNAEISVESEKDVGSTFKIDFPKVIKPRLKKVKEPIKVTPAVSVVGRKEKPLVLVVEDDQNSQRLTSFFLKEQYNTCFAISVEEAKQVLRSKTVRLILLDLSLIGDEDGLDLARYLRKSKRWKDIPIIATTAHAFEKDRENCLNAGCNDYLAKPIKQTDLLDKIKQWL